MRYPECTSVHVVQTARAGPRTQVLLEVTRDVITITRALHHADVIQRDAAKTVSGCSTKDYLQQII